MKEDFLHYLWKYKKFNLFDLQTTQGEPVEVVRTGEHNLQEGPDFFNAQLIIGDQRWAGNVELHNRASQWYAHGHETDPNYDNTILHVVWENDMNVFGSNNKPLPTLLLSEYIKPGLIDAYMDLFDKRKTAFINCEGDFDNVPGVLVENWLERLYLERLERKVNHIDALLADSHNDWEAVLFRMLARNFGTRINGNAFASLAANLPFKVVRKITKANESLEALYLGAAGLLPREGMDEQVQAWTKEYKFIQAKYGLYHRVSVPIQYFRLRPVNFPTIRLSQLASLYAQKEQLFSRAMETRKKTGFYDLFSARASPYWDTHYNFGKEQPEKVKKLSTGFVDLLLINTVVPLMFAYNRKMKIDDQEQVLNLISQISPEKNKITDRFYTMQDIPKNALFSQGLIQLKTEYCDKNQCLKCRVGNYLMDRSAV